jgi:endoglucanase
MKLEVVIDPLPRFDALKDQPVETLAGVGIGNWLLPEGYMFDGLKAPYNSPRGLRQLTHELIGPEDSDTFWDLWEKHFFTPEDVARIAADGYNSIRIAFDWKTLFSGNDLTPRKEGFARLDAVLDACTQHRIAVILDLHGAPGGQNGTQIDDGWGYPWLFESAQARNQTVGIWHYLASRYARHPAIWGYDLLNEPLPEQHARYNPMLEPLYREITAAIRQVDNQHWIILEGAHWATDFTVFGPPFDEKVVYQFHKYWNENNEASLEPFLRFRDRYNVPLWCGETGENTIDWYQACSTLLKTHDIGWNFWPWKKRGKNPSPYNIVMPEDWSAILHYAHEKIRPALPVARNAFQQLSEAIKTTHCQRDEVAISAWLDP